MKQFIIILLVAIGVSSCSEQECCALPEEITMIGTWKLSKLCFSNGASSCEEDDMWDADTNQLITFSDTEFTLEIEGEVCTGTYTRNDEMNVQLTATGGNCNFDSQPYILGRLSATEMMFSPFCTEGCPHLYVRQ